MSEKSAEFKVQLLETFASLITAAFGLVAALAWNDTIKLAVKMLFPTDSGEIYWEKIAVRTDIEQWCRDSIIIEEIYNGLGLVMDTEERTDSIIYQWSDLNTEMSEIDSLLLKLQYHPAMHPGMNREECEAVIRELYY